MRLIGYWIESLLDEDYVAPQELIGPLPDAVRLSVADYLDHGNVYEQYRGMSWCRFGCDSESDCELSDGLWLWPGDLGHYVRDHHVLLPDPFIHHVLEGAPRLPKDDWETQSAPVDRDFWKDWCRANRSGQYRHRLEKARRAADLEADRQMAVAVARVEADEGLSAERCQWVGCTNRALLQQAICARCSFRGQGSPPGSFAYYELLHTALYAPG